MEKKLRQIAREALDEVAAVGGCSADTAVEIFRGALKRIAGSELRDVQSMTEEEIVDFIRALPDGATRREIAQASVDCDFGQRQLTAMHRDLERRALWGDTGWDA